MTTATATDPTNVIPMVHPEAGHVASPEKGTGHVSLGVNRENGRFDGVSDTRFDKRQPIFPPSTKDENPVSVADKLAKVLEELEGKQVEYSHQCRQMVGEILCHPEIANQLREHVRETDARNKLSRYVQGVLAMLERFDAGAAVNVVDLAEVTASDDLPKTFLRDFVKPILEKLNLLLKQENGTFLWVSFTELQTMHDQLYTPKTANDLPLETTGLQMTCNSPVIESGKPANGLRLIGKRLAVNPLAKVRNWQRGQAMKSAVSDPWKKVNADGAVELIHNPYDLNAKCPRTEKEKELIRKAAIVEAEAKLKLKIAAAGDKQLLQEIQRASLEADSQAQAIINEGKLKLAQIHHERMMRNARLATYKPALIIAGLAAAVALFAVANNGAGTGNNTTPNYPVEMANMPLPALGNEE